MKQYIITAMFDDVLLHSFCFVFYSCLVSCLAINVSVQNNGGLLPDIILLISTTTTTTITVLYY